MSQLHIRCCAAVLTAAFIGGAADLKAQEPLPALAAVAAEAERPAPEGMAVLPGTYKDPTHLYSNAAAMQMREAEEARRNHLIAQVSAMIQRQKPGDAGDHSVRSATSGSTLEAFCAGK